MGLFDNNFKDTPFSPIISERPKYPETYTFEESCRILKKIAPNSQIAKVAEKLANTEKSIQNVEKALSPAERLADYILSYPLEEALRILKEGDHIKANRTVYSHHAIYIGNGQVIEYNDYRIKISLLEDFSDGDNILKVNDKTKYSRKKIVQRAYSRLGEEKYNIIWNNCENFAEWCRNGE